jgi:hypothetical protein
MSEEKKKEDIPFDVTTYRRLRAQLMGVEDVQKEEEPEMGESWIEQKMVQGWNEGAVLIQVISKVRAGDWVIKDLSSEFLEKLILKKWIELKAFLLLEWLMAQRKEALKYTDTLVQYKEERGLQLSIQFHSFWIYMLGWEHQMRIWNFASKMLNYFSKRIKDPLTNNQLTNYVLLGQWLTESGASCAWRKSWDEFYKSDLSFNWRKFWQHWRELTLALWMLLRVATSWQLTKKLNELIELDTPLLNHWWFKRIEDFILLRRIIFYLLFKPWRFLNYLEKGNLSWLTNIYNGLVVVKFFCLLFWLSFIIIAVTYYLLENVIGKEWFDNNTWALIILCFVYCFFVLRMVLVKMKRDLHALKLYQLSVK